MTAQQSTCEATLFEPDTTEKVGSGILLTLPQDISATLPTRGMTLVEGTINGAPFQAVLEPDGRGSHWFKVSETLRAAANVDVGDTVTLEIAPTKDWPEPNVPQDLQRALAPRIVIAPYRRRMKDGRDIGGGAFSSLCRKLIRPFDRSYGEISTVTRSPASTRMRRWRILPQA